MQVCIDEVQIIKKIGEGAFGEVSFANIQSHGHVAIKWLKVSALVHTCLKLPLIPLSLPSAEGSVQ